MGMVVLLLQIGAAMRGVSGSCGDWHPGHMAQEPEHLGVEPAGDAGGVRVVVGR